MSRDLTKAPVPRFFPVYSLLIVYRMRPEARTDRGHAPGTPWYRSHSEESQV